MKKLLLLLLLPISAWAQDCKGIEKKVDQFTGDVTYESPLIKQVHLAKIIRAEAKDTVYYLMLTQGDVSSVHGKGVTILFDSGDRLQFPEQKVETNYTSGTYWVSSFIRLTPEEMQKLATQKMKAARLYIKDFDIKTPDKWQSYATCLLASK